MPRSVNAVASRARRKRILKAAKGFYGKRKNVYTVAKNVMEKGLTYKYVGRKIKKREYRALWIARINAAVREEGLLGIKADPNFAKNHYVYIFYSPVDTSVNRLSRFKFENDKIDLNSEKIVLQFYSQREICCHTGGSIAFGGLPVLTRLFARKD